MKHNPDCYFSKRQNLSPDIFYFFFDLIITSLDAVVTSMCCAFVLSTVRPLPGEPQCAGHPPAAGFRDRPHAL